MSLPPGEKIGEAWLVADLPVASSWVTNGPGGEQLLSDVRQAWGERLIGAAWKSRRAGSDFPLLVKFIDAHDDLSVQVHPGGGKAPGTDGAALGNRLPGHPGKDTSSVSKDESWIILDAEPEARILHGFRENTTLRDFDRLLAAGRVAECLRPVAVHPGDMFRVAPGTVHALCRGVMVLEIQEPSDTTFRIYDYDRLGDDGKPRPLHIDEAREVMRFGEVAPALTIPSVSPHEWGCHEILVDVRAYRIERVRVKGTLSWAVDPASTQVVVVVEGEVGLHAEAARVDLKKGDCVILPAAVGAVRLDAGDKQTCCVVAGAGGIPLVSTRHRDGR
jgi:mannose-6-phosphate isomerase